MVRKCHNHILQTNTRQHEEETQITVGHITIKVKQPATKEMLYRDLSFNAEWIKGDHKVGMTLSKQIIIGYLEKRTSNKTDCLSRDSFL